jgi:hypothetical protein
MKSANRNVRSQTKAVGNLVKAGRNLQRNTKLALAVGEVVGARTRIAAAGMVNPAQMDQAEMARIVPEKVIAFNFAGLAFTQHAARMATQMMMTAATEWSAMTRHTLSLASARNPVQTAIAQSSGIWSWWSRAMAQSVALTSNMMSAQQAVLRPIQSTVKSNVVRLSGR